MIIIKNMEIPSSCYDCPFAKNKRTNDYGSFCECGILDDYETINLLEHSKHPNCPLVEQEPILNKIRAEIEQITDTMGVSYNQYISKIDVLKIINKYKGESEDKDV